MRRLVFYLILSADGMYSGPGDSLDHYEPAEDEHRFANDLLRDSGEVVMGRRMYDVMSYWDELDLTRTDIPEVECEYAVLWRERPKHVISRGTPSLRERASVLDGDGDVVEAIRRLKAGAGPAIGLGCGADLFATLAEAGVIDVYRWLVIPKALGTGQAMYASLTRPLDLRLIGTRTFSSGSVLLEYEPANRG